MTCVVTDVDVCVVTYVDVCVLTDVDVIVETDVDVLHATDADVMTATSSTLAYVCVVTDVDVLVVTDADVMVATSTLTWLLWSQTPTPPATWCSAGWKAGASPCRRTGRWRTSSTTASTRTGASASLTVRIHSNKSPGASRGHLGCVAILCVYVYSDQHFNQTNIGTVSRATSCFWNHRSYLVLF